MKKQISIFIACIFMIVSCAAITGTKELTPKQQATVWMSTYNSVYDSAMATMTNPNSTQVQKDLALKKKAILTQIYNPLKLYVAIVEGGGVPATEDAKVINDLIDQLSALVTGGL